MAVTDPYFRFPLSALTYGDRASACLNAIIDYSVVSAGVGSRISNPKEYEALAVTHALPDPPSKRQAEEWMAYQDACVGKGQTSVIATCWRTLHRHYREMIAHASNYPKSALVTMKAKWVWNALDTALQEEGLPARSPNPGWLTWREFRVLCAVLSVIGQKPYAWGSTNTLLHRVCGYTAASSFKGKEPAAHCPRLTRWMLETTLNRLEELRFFMRVRVSRSPTGRGGRTAYTIRHPSREALVIELRTSLFATVADNRKADHRLWTQEGIPTPNAASNPIISKFSPQVGYNPTPSYNYAGDK